MWLISLGLGNRWQHADPGDGVPLWNRYAGDQKGIPDHVREIALLLHSGEFSSVRDNELDLVNSLK